MLRKLNISVVIAAFSLAGCVGGGGGSGTGTGDGTGDNGGVVTPGDSLGLAGGGSTSGGMDNTFDHENETDPFAVLQRIQEQGPPEISTKMHSCQKMKYVTTGNVLKQLGVNMASTTANSAAVLYKNGAQAMGAANYGARVAEAIELTTAGATKLFDIFVQAAPEIIAAMPSRPECTVAGVGTEMFNAANQCTTDGIACLLGVPATPSHLELCNLTIERASDVDKGKRIAVATLLAAAQTCE